MIARLVDKLAARAGDIVADGLQAIYNEIPAYAGTTDPDTRSEVRANLAKHTEILLRCLRSESDPAPQDFEFVRAVATSRAAAGVPLADYLNAHRIYHRHVMDALVEASHDDRETEPALVIARGLLRYANLATTYASDAYLEAQQLLLADEDRIRRDLLEDLIAGREPGTGERLAIAHAAGIGPNEQCAVIIAGPAGPLDDTHALRHAANTIARTLPRNVPPLAVARQAEVVIVQALPHHRASDLAKPLRKALKKLTTEGIPLAIGVSTTLASAKELPDGYREAYVAMQRLLPDPGVLLLEELSAVDYLALRSDDTTRRLMSPQVMQFVADDTQKGGASTQTFLAYVEADLNVSRAAEQLFVHPNTVHYRLGRIAEQTGLDLRKVSDLMELLTAVKLAGLP